MFHEQLINLQETSKYKLNFPTNNKIISGLSSEINWYKK